MHFDTISDVTRYLDSLPSFQVHGAVAAKLGLDRIRSFCALMDHPERNYPAIHIAGTNGKGSVGAMLALVYEKAGYSCALYSSPHLEKVNERIRVNRRMIPDSELLRFCQAYGREAHHMGLSYFEITTAVAFWWFSEQQADIAIIETGLGGRLDATNIIVPEISVITSIAHDHQNFLGRTLAKIAAEKGGIIKSGRPVVLGNLPQSARNILEGMAWQSGAAVHNVRELRPRHSMISRQEVTGQQDTVRGKDMVKWQEKVARQKVMNEAGSVYQISEGDGRLTILSDLAAPVHRWNIAAARLVTRLLDDRFAVPPHIFTSALERMGESGLLRGRFERLSPKLPWYFDGAHNPEAVRELINNIQRQDWDHLPVMVLSIMKDKAQKKMLEPFSVFRKNYYYRLEMERAADIVSITPYIANIQNLPPNEDEITEIFNGFTKQVVIFTGSFYFYGVVKRWISRIIKT